jgi:hypothetical protein
MTSVGWNMYCVYISDVEEILKLKLLNVLEVKLHVRQLITNKEYISDIQQDATI